MFYVQIAEKDAECYSGRRDGKPYVLRGPSSVRSICYAKISSCLQYRIYNTDIKKSVDLGFLELKHIL